ncbi:sigma-70 family RNA polymerase sigma factor [Streptomyces sp. NPDC059002]|uniref:sigma-70 family RNA polymerase sigma factor n=1 Tax=Streptomyces sp. NPDC059002 TaxID=3346690 RepID=UPI003683B609
MIHSGRREKDRAGRQADEEFITALYTEHGARLRSFLRARRRRHRAGRGHGPGDPAAGLEVRTPRPYRRLHRASVRSWLLTIAGSVLVDHHRAEQRRPSVPSSPEDLTRHHDTAPVDRVDDQVVDRWLVEEALRRLTRQHREVVAELYYAGHTVTEAAARLGIPEGTVKSRAYYAVRALRAAFDELGVTR